MRHPSPGLCAPLALLLALGAAGCDDEDNPDEIEVNSAAFGMGNTIPLRHTCDGAEISPPLTFGNLPEGTETLALSMEDPDASGGTVSHWVLWGIPRDKGFLGEDQPKVADLGQGMTQGTSSFTRRPRSALP